jgi:hypothetical protein
VPNIKKFLVKKIFLKKNHLEILDLYENIVSKQVKLWSFSKFKENQQALTNILITNISTIYQYISFKINLKQFNFQIFIFKELFFSFEPAINTTKEGKHIVQFWCKYGEVKQ